MKRVARPFAPLAAVACLVAACVAVASLGVAAPVGAGVGHRERYLPPTQGEVIDPFRPPPEPWLAGNRGIEYATAPGSALTAIGPGVVTFAGPVARRRVITVRHPDGLRSSLTGVEVILVRVGDRVRGGQVIASAGATVHLGVRRGRQYLDPASLWGSEVGGGTVHLVPLDGGRRSPNRSPTRQPTP